MHSPRLDRAKYGVVRKSSWRSVDGLGLAGECLRRMCECDMSAGGDLPREAVSR